MIFRSPPRDPLTLRRALDKPGPPDWPHFGETSTQALFQGHWDKDTSNRPGICNRNLSGVREILTRPLPLILSDALEERATSARFAQAAPFSPRPGSSEEVGPA